MTSISSRLREIADDLEPQSKYAWSMGAIVRKTVKSLLALADELDTKARALDECGQQFGIKQVERLAASIGAVE